MLLAAVLPSVMALLLMVIVLAWGCHRASPSDDVELNIVILGDYITQDWNFRLIDLGSHAQARRGGEVHEPALILSNKILAEESVEIVRRERHSLTLKSVPSCRLVQAVNEHGTISRVHHG